MTLQQATEWANSRPLTLTMAYGVIKWNEDYVIVTGPQMKRYNYNLLHIVMGSEYTFN